MKKTSMSLIEIVMILGSVFIVVNIAWQSYERFQQKERRLIAQHTLLNLVDEINELERTHSLYNYPMPELKVKSKYYHYIIKHNEIYYRLFAIPQLSQVRDGILQATTTGLNLWDKDNNAPDPNLYPESDRYYEEDFDDQRGI